MIPIRPRNKLTQAGWVLSERGDSPRGTLCYSYAKNDVRVTLLQKGNTHTEWEGKVSCKDTFERVFHIGGSPSQAVAQALSSTLEYLRRCHNATPELISTVTDLLSQLPDSLEE